MEKGVTLASAIVSLRPEVSVEIGVYAGKGIISMGLAHRYTGHGKVIGIDPYSADASIEGQFNDGDKQFWEKLDHEMIYNICQQSIRGFDVKDQIEIIRKRSDEVDPPSNIGVIRIDGNHGDAVLSDVERYAPNVTAGGLLFLDDIGWTGGSVERAARVLSGSGWKELYKLEDGAVFQKLSV